MRSLVSDSWRICSPAVTSRRYQGQRDDRQAQQHQAAQGSGTRQLHARDSRKLQRRMSLPIGVADMGYQGSRSSFCSQRRELATMLSRSSSSGLPAEHRPDAIGAGHEAGRITRRGAARRSRCSGRPLTRSTLRSTSRTL